MVFVLCPFYRVQVNTGDSSLLCWEGQRLQDLDSGFLWEMEHIWGLKISFLIPFCSFTELCIGVLGTKKFFISHKAFPCVYLFWGRGNGSQDHNLGNVETVCHNNNKTYSWATNVLFRDAWRHLRGVGIGAASWRMNTNLTSSYGYLFLRLPERGEGEYLG